MRTPARCFLASLACSLVTLSAISCKSPDAPPNASRQDDLSPRLPPVVVRIEGVSEPLEFLIPSEGALRQTPELTAFQTLVSNMKGGHEIAILPDVDAFIDKYPRFGDAYPLRATLRCIAGNMQGAKADAETAISGLPRLINDTPETDRNEMLVMLARLALIDHDDGGVSNNLHKVIASYSNELTYLADGGVKVSHKTTTPCAWGQADIEEWLARSHNATEAQVFRVMFASSFAQFDDEAKGIAQRYSTDTMRANPSSAPAYFYGAVATEKIDGFMHFVGSDADKAAYDRHMIELWSKAVEIDPSIEEAFAGRAQAHAELKNYSAAVSDYSAALNLNPNHEALWNDRGLAKQETYDKSGAISDFTKDIELERKANNLHGMTYPLENRGDLYVKLNDYKHAADDYTSLISIRLHDIMVFINLGFIRELYPQYAKVDDSKLKDKIHRMFVPNYTDANFETTISNPAGMSPTMDGGIRETYLKRADVLLALKRFDDARHDYYRAELFKERQEGDRWRTPPGFNGMSLDVKTLETANPQQLKAWVKPPEDDKTPEPEPTRFTINCKAHTVQMGHAAAFEPIPGTYAEAVSDFFCSSVS